MVSSSRASAGPIQSVQFDYNGRGERVWRSSGNEKPALYAYDESGRLLGEYSDSGALISEVVWLDDLPVGVIRGSTVYPIEADHLGSPRVVAQSGAAIWRWDLFGAVFGEGAPNEDPDGNSTTFRFDLRFPGQQADATTGLSYNYFRDYESGTGRYVESDPIGLFGGINTYMYVLGGPLIMTDTDGLAPQICCRLLANPFFGRLLRLRHCYVQDDTDVFSLAPEKPRWLTGKLWTDYDDDTKDAKDRDPATKCKTCVPKNCTDNPSECIRNGFEQYPNPSRYGFIGSNSNTMAGNIFSNCCEGNLGRNDGLGNTPGISQSPAKPK